MNIKTTIDPIVKNGLCLSCGTCAAVCPVGAISMQEIPGGLLEAMIDTAKCTECWLCGNVCPGSHLEKEVLPENIDPFRGSILKAFVIKASNNDVLRNGQSGGVVTALLQHLMEKGHIAKALVTEMPNDGTLRPQAKMATNPENLFSSQGSKYCPVPVNQHLIDWLQSGSNNTAIVGLPCHIHGLHNIQTVLPKTKVSPYITFGLFCDRILSFTAMDYLISRAGLDRNEVSSFRSKSKELGGWPGNIGIKSKDGRIRPLSGSRRMECKNYFTPLRCRLCFDKFNVLADLSFGDAWGVQEDSEGVSVVIARTERGLETIESAMKAHAIEGNEVSVEKIYKGQGLSSKREDWLSYMAAWDKMGYLTPKFEFQDRFHSNRELGNLKQYKRNLSYSWRIKEAKSREKIIRKAKMSIYPRRLWAKWKPKRVARALKNRFNRLGIG